jgi:hypothetical protein
MLKKSGSLTISAIFLKRQQLRFVPPNNSFIPPPILMTELQVTTDTTSGLMLNVEVEENEHPDIDEPIEVVESLEFESILPRNPNCDFSFRSGG